jgi:hypothetical protein
MSSSPRDRGRACRTPRRRIARTSRWKNVAAGWRRASLPGIRGPVLLPARPRRDLPPLHGRRGQRDCLGGRAMERGLVAPSLQVRHSRTGGASRRRDRCESWPFVDSAQAAGRPVLDHWCQDFYTTKWCANAVTESAWDFVRDSGPDAQAIGSCDASRAPPGVRASRARPTRARAGCATAAASTGEPTRRPTPPATPRAIRTRAVAPRWSPAASSRAAAAASAPARPTARASACDNLLHAPGGDCRRLALVTNAASMTLDPTVPLPDPNE